MQTLLATLLKNHFPATFGGHLEFLYKMKKCIYLGNGARESMISMKFLNHKVYALSWRVFTEFVFRTLLTYNAKIHLSQKRRES